ncbi:copper chaperone PCu(A)C [Streptomyces sp. AC512_CC834]|uniref:copper chaperone PCu(A)C n=1 Tax=Streptomyces sp. AC512_CC834 TaxID=2823691 RepID=UPI001C25F5F9|nr:copper chaperone PCu(A)C [Streptomyces sp. AC512_CC834]
MAALPVLWRRKTLSAYALAVALAASGCGGDDDFSLPDWGAPGQNARVGDIMIRYAHVAEPRDEPWQPGDDVPAYVWLYNMGGEDDRLVGASTPNAASVDVVDSDGKERADGVSLPAHKLVELERGKNHLVLRDVRETVRGGDFMEFTLRFENAGPVTFDIHAQVPVYDESPSPTG